MACANPHPGQPEGAIRQGLVEAIGAALRDYYSFSALEMYKWSSFPDEEEPKKNLMG